MIVIYDSKINKQRFDSEYVNYVLNELLNKNIVTSEKLSEISSKFQDKFVEYIGGFFLDIGIQAIFSESETEIVFENFMYIIGFYMYENIDDLFVALAYFENFSQQNFDEAIDLYKSKVRYMETTLEEIKETCDIPLIHIKYYLDTLIAGVKLFNIYSLFGEEIRKISDISLDGSDEQIQNISKLPTEILTFKLEERVFGIYDNLVLVESIKAQFELYSKLDSNRISEVYLGLAFDYSGAWNRKIHHWGNLLTPILLQLIFCSEYSDEEVSMLKLCQADFSIMIAESMKSVHQAEDTVQEFYMANVNKTKLSDEVKRVFAELDFKKDTILEVNYIISKYNDTAFEDLIEVPVQQVKNEISQVLNSDLTSCQREYLNSLFSKLTEDSDTRKRPLQLEMSDDFEKNLVNNFLKSEIFESLSEPTRKYIKSKMPQISSKLLDYFTSRKNCFCYID